MQHLSTTAGAMYEKDAVLSNKNRPKLELYLARQKSYKATKFKKNR
jgi:hypothetical protein